MKTNEETNVLQEENANKKLDELNEEELASVVGGKIHPLCGCVFCNYSNKESCTYYNKILHDRSKCIYS